MFECLCRTSIDDIVSCITSLCPEGIVEFCIMKHAVSHFLDSTDVPFTNTILVLSIRGTWLKHNSINVENFFKGFIVIFPMSIVTTEPSYLKAGSILSNRLEVSKGFGNFLCCLRPEKVNPGHSGKIINVNNEVSISCN